MPKKIALDLSGATPRAVIAMVSSTGSVQVLSVDEIPVHEATSSFGDAVTDALSQWVAQRKLAGTETIVLAGRRDVEVRTLALPPVADAELPDMVRLQALRKFSAASERSPVDFIPLRRNAEGVEVMAASISSEAMTRIRSEIQTSDLTLGCVTLRSLGMVGLELASEGSADGDRAVLTRIDDETELAVLSGGSLASIRTVRTPAKQSAEATAKALAGEIKRTRMAIADERESARDDSTVVDWWGDASIADALAAESGHPVGKRSIGEVVSMNKSVSLPADDGAFAPLVGALLAHGAGGQTIIDFVNPRRRPEVKPNHLRTAALIAAPLLAVAGITQAIHSKFSGLDREIELLDEQLASMQPSIEIANRSMSETESIDSFLDGDVLWLNEVQRLAEKMPPSDKMIVKELKGTVRTRGGGGSLQIKGGVTSPNVLDQFADSLRDEAHRVVGDGASESAGKDSYRWAYTETVVIDPESVRQMRYEKMEAASLSEPPIPAETPSPSASETPATDDSEPGEQSAAVAEVAS